MSRFYLVEIEKEPTESFPCWGELDHNRETEFRIYERYVDQYGNKSSHLITTTPNIEYAKRFLRSCRLTEGIMIEE